MAQQRIEEPHTSATADFPKRRKKEVAQKICDLLWSNFAKPLSACQTDELRELFAQYLADCIAEQEREPVVELCICSEQWLG